MTRRQLALAAAPADPLHLLKHRLPWKEGTQPTDTHQCLPCLHANPSLPNLRALRSDVAFTTVFGVEMLMKVLAFTFVGYIKQPINQV